MIDIGEENRDVSSISKDKRSSYEDYPLSLSIFGTTSTSDEFFSSSVVLVTFSRSSLNIQQCFLSLSWSRHSRNLKAEGTDGEQTQVNEGD